MTWSHDVLQQVPPAACDAVHGIAGASRLDWRLEVALSLHVAGTLRRARCSVLEGRWMCTASCEMQQQAAADKPKVPDLEELLTKRDYLGAIALLQFRRHANRNDVKNLEWLAYCYFHYGEHDKVRTAVGMWDGAVQWPWPLWQAALRSCAQAASPCLGRSPLAARPWQRLVGQGLALSRTHASRQTP